MWPNRMLRVLSCLLVLSATACDVTHEKQDMSGARIEPAHFAGIQPPVDGKTECSPALPADPRWQGLVIDAPVRVRKIRDETLIIPVCIAGTLPHGASRHPLQIVALDTRTGERYSDNAYYRIMPDLEAPMPPDAHVPENDDELVSSELEFTTDLVVAAGIPAGHAATYEVYVERTYDKKATIRSNSIMIEVILDSGNRTE